MEPTPRTEVMLYIDRKRKRVEGAKQRLASLTCSTTSRTRIPTLRYDLDNDRNRSLLLSLPGMGSRL
ncbi:hypothetical protein GW17_00021248 [Ensete ventricosum]|nr:hypothetical protein GW17_00021248 [Ensete ventricosum]RZR87993.1 hypothetical protein BHM03_00015495 [Ensete ventricosum]